MTALSSFTELKEHELMEVNGGWNPERIAQGLGTIASATSAAMALGGQTIMSMSVGAALACGPIGWAIVGIITIGGFVGGCLIGDRIIN